MQLTYKEFLNYCKKNTPQVYFDYYYRKLSYPLSYLFIRLNITPNQIAITQTVLYLLGAIVIYRGYVVYGLLIFMLSYLLDFCDGNVARAWLKISSLPEVTISKGLLLENLNTNFALFMMYGALGFYLTEQSTHLYFLILAFLVFGIKMISRYTSHQAYPFFQALQKDIITIDNLNVKYQESFVVKVKFFLRKSFFSANFYYVVYLISFTFFPLQAAIIFISYAVLDGALSLLRLVMIFMKSYK